MDIYYLKTPFPYFYAFSKKEVNYKSKMISYINPTKISIYVNTQKKTMAQVKAETGCTHIINGGLFDMTTFLPCCHLKVDGKVYASESDTYWGYGWNTVNDISIVSNYTNYNNYIACICLIRNSVAEPFYGVQDVARGRTAFGIMPDGRFVLYCTTDANPIKPSDLRSYFLSLGAKSAILLDGGLSSSCDFNGNVINTSRPIHNYICFWDKDSVVEIPKIIYRVQCGAFSVYANCVNLKTQINSLPDTIGAGYAKAYIRNINGKYKLQIGAFTNRSGAEKVLADLKSKGFNAFITTE
jgi:hypothetical protein